MNMFACGSCISTYNRKTAPRYVSAAETEYPCSLSKTCAQCGEISTPMEICLGCALENNQCQNCCTKMFGVNEKLLDQIRQFRACFNQSVALHRAVFAAAISPFKEELDSFLAANGAAEERMTSDIEGLDTEKAAERYRKYLTEMRERPFAHRAQYAMAQEELTLCMRADRNLFKYLVEHAFAQNRLRYDLISNLSQAVSAREPHMRATRRPMLLKQPWRHSRLPD